MDREVIDAAKKILMNESAGVTVRSSQLEEVVKSQFRDKLLQALEDVESDIDVSSAARAEGLKPTVQEVTFMRGLVIAYTEKLYDMIENF